MIAAIEILPPSGTFWETIVISLFCICVPFICDEPLTTPSGKCDKNEPLSTASVSNFVFTLLSEYWFIEP